MNVHVPSEVRAKRGNDLRCKGWRQESILRMFENNLENAEDVSKLVVYGSNGKAARNWESFHAIVDALTNLKENETLAVQAVMPVAIIRTHRLAPRVVMANTNVIQANWPMFYDLMEKNLTTYSSYTAGPWEYIGSQDVVEGPFETLGKIAEEHFSGELKGRIFFTAGLGGMGRSQPFAMTLHGGISVVVEVRKETIKQRLQAGYADIEAKDLDDAIRLAEEARKAGEPLGILLHGNMAEVLEEALSKGWRPDIVTEMCPCHDPYMLLPAGMTPEEAADLRDRDRDGYLQQSRASVIRIVKAMNQFLDASCIVFEYGTFVRKEAADAGLSPEEAFRYLGCIARYIRPMFLEGRGPFRWTCISGNPDDQERLDDLVLSQFPNCPIVQRWIPRARAKLPNEGLPARVCFLGFGQHRVFALAVNELLKKGELEGPVAFSRDNLDCGSIANSAFETEQMIDGSDAISNWPYLNALLNTAAMCDLIAIQANGAMGISAHTGVTMIADGTEEADLCLDACLTTDVGIGIVRHAQAGYDQGKVVANGDGVGGNCKSLIYGNPKSHSFSLSMTWRRAVLLAKPTERDGRTDARMGDQDVVEALSGTGRLEDGVVAALRGKSWDDPLLAQDGPTGPGSVGRCARICVASGSGPQAGSLQGDPRRAPRGVPEAVDEAAVRRGPRGGLSGWLQARAGLCAHDAPARAG